ncbi:MAG TPA: GNAT family N-acetyltransferase [Gemmatimonadaceae bacterium]|nr:GNAT family N-acetyltransferase [Gemmatimonadaceae bacterium]
MSEAHFGSTEQPTLSTARLVLRPFLPEDAPAVQRLAGAREIADTTLTIPHPYPDGAAELWIATHEQGFAAGTVVVFAVTERESGDVVGAVGLVVEPAHASAELGYWIATPYWGRGYATEAAGALVAFALGPLGLHRVQARHLIRNPASGRVMQKLGMRLEGVHRHAVRKWDAFEDVALYAILETDARPEG